MCSTPGYAWSRTLSRVCRRVGALFREGVTTLIEGSAASPASAPPGPGFIRAAPSTGAAVSAYAIPVEGVLSLARRDRGGSARHSLVLPPTSASRYESRSEQRIAFEACPSP